MEKVRNVTLSEYCEFI